MTSSPSDPWDVPAPRPDDPWSVPPATPPGGYQPTTPPGGYQPATPADTYQPATPADQPAPPAGGSQPVPAVAPEPGPVIVQIAEISVTSTAVLTPTGNLPLAGSHWQVNDYWFSQQRIPRWAIIVAIAGFCV